MFYLNWQLEQQANKGLKWIPCKLGKSHCNIQKSDAGYFSEHAGISEIGVVHKRKNIDKCKCSPVRTVTVSSKNVCKIQKSIFFRMLWSPYQALWWYSGVMLLACTKVFNFINYDYCQNPEQGAMRRGMFWGIPRGILLETPQRKAQKMLWKIYQRMPLKIPGGAHRQAGMLRNASQNSLRNP